MWHLQTFIKLINSGKIISHATNTLKMFLNILLLKTITKYTFSFIANIKRICKSIFVLVIRTLGKLLKGNWNKMFRCTNKF